MDTGLFLTYCVTIFVASIIPGPSMLLAMNFGRRGEVQAGNAAAIGNVVASLLQAAITFWILLTIGHINEFVMIAIKYTGAAYIIFVGIQLFSVERLANKSGYKQELSQVTPVMQGFNFAIANPKALIFFAALFPAFVNPGLPVPSQLLWIMGPIAVIAYVCFIAYVFAGRALMVFFAESYFIGKILSITIIGAGISLIIF